jgi:PAS domain S-box-containing protein
VQPQQTAPGTATPDAAPLARPALHGYGAAVVAVVVMTLLRLALNPLLGETAPFMTFWIALVFTGWYGGFGPAFLAIGLSALSAAAFFLPPAGSLAVTSFRDQMSLLTFVVGGTAVGIIGEAGRRALLRAAEAHRGNAEILASISDGVVVVDNDWRYTFANDQALAILGKPREELIGRKTWEVFPEIRQSPSYPFLQSVMERREKDQLEFHSPAVGRWLNQVAYPSADGVTIYFQDVTARRAAEEERRRAQDLLGITLRSIGDAVITTDTAARVQFLNSIAESLTGWTEEEARGRPCAEVFRIINETSRDVVESPVDRVIREGNIVGLANHTLLIARDGTERPIDDSGAPIRGADGSLHGVVLVFRDITERKREEAERDRLLRALQAQRDRMDSLVASVPGVVWEAWGVPDEESQRINFVSDYVEPMLGYTREEWLSTPNFWFTIVHPDDQTAAGAVANRLFTSGEPGSNIFRWVRKDGRAIWVEGQSVTILDENGSPAGMRGVTLDITERVQAQEERDRHLREIEELNTRLQRAMRETHHRVKNNLQVITALVEMQRMLHAETVPVSELQRLMQHIQALAAIHDMLTGQARALGNADTISVRVTLERIVPMMEAILGGRPVRLHVRDADLPVRQGTSLAVLVNELVSNATKHGQGEICVSFHAEDGRATLTVEDDGPGFPPDFHPSSSGNTGMELIESLARWDLRGDTRYENLPGGGARVTVTFPLPERESSVWEERA